MMTDTEPTNDEIADLLERLADLLEDRGESVFRIGAYRQGAQTVRALERPVATIYRDGGVEALQKLPRIGQGLSSAISEYIDTGRSSLLDRLQAETDPEAVFARLPGIGPELASRIATELKVRSLEDLETAVHDGRLESVEGMGPERVRSVRLALAGMLSPAARRSTRERAVAARQPGSGGDAVERPSVDLLLRVDEEYRRRAEADELEKIAPRRFNPEGEAWLPVLRVRREGWDFVALFSNTARAHELGTTRDWVVIYYSQGDVERQSTVVTANRGPLEGRRVVRGREAECRRYYAEQGAAAEAGAGAP
jgi:DNA polymerase (family X)